MDKLYLTIYPGIMVTVTVLVAAGVAVYQSPQFQEWMNNSRRKIAVALHSLGDEIQPRGSASPTQDDISMTEEIGEAAKLRREAALKEIERKAALLESQKNSRNSQQRSGGSFDTIVDQEGSLRMQNKYLDHPDVKPVADSTGIDTGAPQRRRTKLNDLQLHVGPASESASLHPSESVPQLTPTSERPDLDLMFESFSGSPSPVSASASTSHTEDNSVYYAHPHASNVSEQPELTDSLEKFGNGNQLRHDVSSAPSEAGSFDIVAEGSSDGTLSDWGMHSVGGVATPTSWSEVGSVISDNDAGHQHLL
ncbi:hypothetical protein N7490_010098 [Penicillium lividum]|nr:hypothetical protein N7490_010098 [Penicillium lividum]